ncbi:MAG: ABC transporter substrate-binding protein [Actinobacteria bacterium]|nr:ABC transporter substrate-binding protein [Actinomycetota bacterium]
MTEVTFELPQRPGLNRRKLKWIGLVTLAVVLAAIVTWLTITVLRTCGPLGSGVYEVDGDCVGVTDGSYVFQPDFAKVQGLIAQENARVRDEYPSYVTVALLDPLTPSSGNVLLPGEVRNRLEGAYTALRQVNTTRLVGDPNPQIQLLLASEGSTDAQRQRVIDQLVDMSKREDNPLVAVIGLGVSTEETKQRAKALSGHGIPMVSAYLVADELNYDQIPGLIRTSPSNRNYVEALRNYVESTDIKSAAIVRDFNSERGDLFTQTLEANFTDQLKDIIAFPSLQFTGTGVPAKGVDPRLFANVTNSICAATAEGLQAILYAGREVDLDSFIKSLEARPCPRTPLTILTAGLDLGEILGGEREQDLDAAELSVVVAATVDADGWEHNVPGTPEHYNEFLSVFQGGDPEVMKQGFDPAHLNGANAIMMHDAVLAAARSIRLAAPEGVASSPEAGDVRAQLLNLSGQNTVPGASGTLSFSAGLPSEESAKGNPAGKPVPVLQYPRPSPGPSRQVGPLYCVLGTLGPTGQCTS